MNASGILKNPEIKKTNLFDLTLIMSIHVGYHTLTNNLAEVCIELYISYYRSRHWNVIYKHCDNLNDCLRKRA